MGFTSACKNYFSDCWKFMVMKKPFSTNILDTQLKRCLTTFDLTIYGIGNMAGTGVYVLTGSVMKDKAGPGIFISFIIAGLVAMVNALCYGELGARIPKAGSAYVFTYVAVGQFIGFVIGWSLVLEYVLSISSVARGWSGTIDSLANGAWSNFSIKYIGEFTGENEWFGKYPDLLSLITIVCIGLVLLTGAKMSTFLNNIITFINVSVLLVMSIFMFTKPYSSPVNHPDNSNTSFISGNNSSGASSSSVPLMPFGFSGLIAGAGTCFFTFVGFDAVTVSSEEAINPKRSMPIATSVSVLITMILCTMSSASLAYFLPDWRVVDIKAPFSEAFRSRDITWGIYFVGVGSMFGISASLFTAFYAMPRIVYAMAEDQMIMSVFCKLFPRSKVPAVAIAVFGAIAALLAIFFKLESLADFLSIGTLIAYLLVAVNAILLRFSRNPININLGNSQSQTDNTDKPNLPSDMQRQRLSQSQISSYTLEAEDNEWFERAGMLKRRFQPVQPQLQAINESGYLPHIGTTLFSIFSIFFCLTIQSSWSLYLLIPFGLGMCVGFTILCLLEQNNKFDSFKMPLMPFNPCLCIFMNLILIIHLSPLTWLRFFVWLLIGLIVYFGYSIPIQRKTYQPFSNDFQYSGTL